MSRSVLTNLRIADHEVDYLDELRNKLGGRARSSIYLDLEHARLSTPLKLGGRLYWEEDQINKWIKERLRHGQRQ